MSAPHELVKEMLSQRRAGLISDAEAWEQLDNLSNQAQFNADYSDDPALYHRWVRVARDARGAADSIHGSFRRKSDPVLI